LILSISSLQIAKAARARLLPRSHASLRLHHLSAFSKGHAMANPHADLGALTIRRAAATPTHAEIRHPRHLISRVVLPLLLLGGFLAVFAWSSWDWLVPPLSVQVIPVQTRLTTAHASGSELFKANGWIEPSPLPVDVPIQTEGMYRVEAVHVNPGERVRKGQLLVALDDAKARLDLESVEKKLARRNAATASVQADLGKAEVGLKNAGIALDLSQAQGEAEIQAETSEIAKTQALLASAELSLKVEEDLVKQGVAAGDVKIAKARQQRDVASADWAAAQARVQKVKTAALTRTKLAETAQATAAAELRSLQAKREEALQEAAEVEVDLRKARLELERTRIFAPQDGVIMQLHARVGFMMGGKNGNGDHKEAAVTLYDPSQLQVRVEVPINKFQFVRNGQPAIIEIEDVLPGRKIEGRVLYDTHQANIARNSVPVKVALANYPHEFLRPDMIASVRFLAPPSQETPKPQAVERIAVPRRLLNWDGDQARVWIIDQEHGRAELQPVQLAPGEGEKKEEWVELSGGVRPTDKLITTGLEQLKLGLRVKITSEDR
jgi:HlyD family secretion protein